MNFLYTAVSQIFMKLSKQLCHEELIKMDEVIFQMVKNPIFHKEEYTDETN